MDTRWDKLRATAEQAQQEGMFEFAETNWIAALEEAEDFGDSDRRLAYTLERLGECLWHQGKLTDAASHCKRVLKMYEKVLGPDHIDVACFAGNLAMIYHARKEYDKAEIYYKKALKIKKGSMDADHPDLSKLVGNYADLLQVTDRPDEARKLKTGPTVVTASDWKKGTSAHPAFNRGGDNGDQGASDGKDGDEKKNRKTGKIIKLLPDDSHTSLPAMESKDLEKVRTDTYSQGPTPPQQKKPIPPAAPQKPALPTPPGRVSTQKQIAMPDGFEFGKTGARSGNTTELQQPTQVQQDPAEEQEDPLTTWKSHKETAERAQHENNLDAAESEWLLALALAEQIGEDKPPLSYTLSSLGDIKARQERFGDAIPYHLRAFNIKKKVLGSEHIAVAQSANALARLYYNVRDYSGAEPLAKECVRIYERELGEEHQDLACALHNLATLFHVQRRYHDAEPAYKRALAIKSKVLGSDHPDTARLLRSFADLLRSTHREAEADHLDTCATGMITGSWKAIDMDEAESLLSRDDRCDICNAQLQGEPKCLKCGFEAAIGVF